MREAEPPFQGNRITYDTRLPGFGLRVTSGGSRSFVFNYRINGRERRITIGRYPAWTVLAARKQAEHLRRQVDTGVDPLESRITAREAPTVRALFQRYEEEHLPTNALRSAADDRANVEERYPPRARWKILKRRLSKAAGPQVFAGSTGAAFQDVRRTWAAVCKSADLESVRLHDLRHTLASLVASSGQSLMVVGELLGHSTAQTTKRYAHLYDDALRTAAEGVSLSLAPERNRSRRAIS